jgi:outer membrane protein
MRMIWMVLAALLYIGVFPVSAADEQGDILWLSLQEAQNYAVKHSTETRNAQLDVAAAMKKIWETTASGLPQISASTSYVDNLKIPTTLIPAQFIDPDAEEGTFIGLKFGTQHSATLELNVNQLIFSGSYIVALQASRIYLQLSKDQLSKSEIEVKDAVTKTYYLILLAEEHKQTLETNLENVKKILLETRELYKAGFVEDTDADQLQLSVTDLENAVKSMKRQIEVTYRLLKFQMGLDLNKEIRLSQTLEKILDDLNSRDLLAADADLTQHIDYRILDTREKSSKLLLRREKSEYLPTISAFFSYSQMAMRESFNFFSRDRWYPSMLIGLNINIPIFSSGMRGARVAQAKLDLRKITNLKLQVADGLRLELLQARSEFSDALEKNQNLRQNRQLAKKIYDKTQVKYSNGMASSLELTQTHNQYLTAQSNYISGVVDLLNAKTRLDKVLNRL